MTDTNGRVAAEHLGAFAGYPVSLIILEPLRAASLQFHQEGYTFALVRGFPGYREFDVQGGMRNAFDAHQFGVAPYFLSGAPGSRPAKAGHSHHGFGLAIDVASNAPLARRDAILAAHGFHLWSDGDRNHYEFGDATAAPPTSAFASLNQQPLENDMPNLIRIIFDQGVDIKDGLFASTAIFNETTGWVQTSAGFGPRDDLAMYSAIAGALGFNVTEVHVNHDGWLMAQHFIPPTSKPPAVDIAAIIKGVTDGTGKKIAKLTVDELTARLTS